MPNDAASGPAPQPVSGEPPRLAWHHAASGEVAAYWETDAERGLDEALAKSRLHKLGPNRLPEAPPDSLWKKLWAQVSDFTVVALLAAAAIAGTLGYFYPTAGASFMERFGDSLAILLIVILNAAIGLAQQRRAERALGALRQMAAPTAHVIRSGRRVD